MSEFLAIGIDVSKQTLDIALAITDPQGGHQYQHRKITNTAAEITAFAETVTGFNGKVVMESTGRYHLLCALLLSQAGLDVRVVNPLLAKQYVSGAIHNHKTDKADARALARMAALEDNLPTPFRASQKDILLRQKIGLLASLEKQLQSLTGILREYTEFQQVIGGDASMSEQELHQTVVRLRKQKQALQREVEQAVSETPKRTEDQVLLQSVPGISPYFAALILHCFQNDSAHPKQWIAFCGINILARQSGKWHGRGRLSHRGNPYLRKRLYCCAWGAIMHNTAFRSYYDTLRQRDLSHKEALLVISRRLLCIAHTLLKKREVFDEVKCFSS